MSKENSFTKKSKTDLPDAEGKPVFILNRHVLFGLLAFIILAALSASLIYQQYRIIKQEQKKEGYTVAENAKEKLQQALINSLSATKILSFFIDQNGQVKNFDSVAAQILSTNKGIDALELVPGGVIQHIYPLEGNENVIGYNILKDSTRRKEALTAIEKNELFFSGPFDLRQGGFGIVGRLPVFRNGKFWGFSAVVIKMTTLLKAVDIDTTGKKGYYFQLSKINPGTGKNEFFIPHATKALKDYAIYVELPIGDWKLSVEPVVQNKADLQILILAIIGFLFSAFGGIFVANILRRPQKLEMLVKERTRELKGSEKKYRSVVERVSDAFIALDVNWIFTYVNEKAGEILKKKPEMLIGENIWAEFPEAILQPFYQAYHRAMQMQEYQYLEEYDPHLNKWIENHIYPSKDGLTVFFKDVTEIKQITLALKNKEEKYRSLIEYASDGIVITDLDGIILEVNKSIQQMIDHTDEELIGHHLTDFLPQADMEINPLRIHELMQGKSLLYERKLLKKDGTVLDVEINSKMASSHTLIGFIRDITERKKYEDTLSYQARLLESVSDAVASLDMNRAIVSWNNACDELFGFTAAEVIGKRIPDLITFEYPNTNNEEVFKQVFKEGQWKGEFNFVHPKTKEKLNLLSSINLLRDKEGSVSGFIITSKNITDRIKAAEEISISNERFELIAQATNDAIWDHDFIKNETWGNKNLYNIYGLEYGKEKIDLEMFLSRIEKDQRSAIEQRMKNAIGHSLTSLSEEFRFKTANGEFRNFYDRAYIKYNGEGKPLRILGAMQDVTDREIIKQQIIREKELSDSIINSLPGIFYLYNKAGKLLRWNINFETVTGYTGEEISHLYPLDFFDVKDRVLLKEKIANVFVVGEGYLEADFLLKNKEKIPYYFTGQAIEYEGEKCLMGVGLDFSERKKAEKEILLSKQQFQNLVENISGVYWVNDLETYETLYISPSYETIWGLKCEDLYKNPADFINAVHPDDKGFLMDAHKNIGNTLKANTTYRIIRPDGEIRWISAKTNVVIDSRGYKIEYGYAEDITQRKQAEEVLGESERFLKETQLIAKLGTYTLNITSGKWISSPILDEIFGIDPSFNKTVESWQSIIHPDWQKIMIDYFMEDVIGRKEEFNKEYKIIRVNDKAERWVYGVGSLKLNENGEPIMMVGTIHDVTDRKQAEEELFQSEQKYRLLFYNNPLPMWMTTIPGLDIIDVNEAAIKQYGYTREEFLKMNTKNLRPAEDVANFLKEVEKMNPDAINTRAWRHKRKDGTVIHVETYSHQIIYEGKKVWLGLSHDVTEKYQAKELLQKSYEDIRQLASNLQNIREDERTNIAREIHDELGQQLTGLKMDLHWLTRKINSTDNEVMDKMKASIELINATITSVRKISTDLRPSILDDLGLLPALEWQGEEFEKRSGTKVLFINKAGDIKVQAQAATAIFRIYQELLTNVARHANASLVKAVLDKDESNLYFSISDNGVGFDLETIKNKKTLGLLGIKERTLLLGGTYEFINKPGEGSVTTISIPLTFVKTTI